ncbi:three-Cys-motif partner protein TcmP [Thiofilum flexile]|uniref:three-Cys-motif partner protein TcmP n=1 Tax=Thiofilum flexile TaxID=125627 RepID=UPI00037F2F08|nr:three-Cys-motif partner protein TcmP [Thiofilum flexile]
MAHKFGGAWTEIKLAILRDYLSFYTKALQYQPTRENPFQLMYIDAFAGTGEREQIIQEAAPLFNEEKEVDILDGSARIALATQPAFASYHFIEKKKKHYERLQEIVQSEEYKHLKDRIKLYHADANNQLSSIIHTYLMGRASYLTRAVLFLDPYGLGVEWSTLQQINATEKTDLWFLFSLSGLYRNTSIEFDNIENYKKQRINTIFGTDEWQRIFYSNEYTDKQGDLFGGFSNKTTRTASIKELENYVHQRLSSLFHYVAQPVPLPVTGVQQFSLFLCVSNKGQKATDLAKRVANDIIRNHLRMR